MMTTMSLSDDLSEAIRVYFFLQNREGKTIGGPYPYDATKIAKGIKRAVARGIAYNDVVVRKMVAGRYTEPSDAESEAILGAYQDT